MQEHRITLPVLALFGGTRAMTGFGLGLLISNRLASARRRAVGLTLLLTGALSTIPLGLWLFRGRRAEARERERARRSTTAAAMMAD